MTINRRTFVKRSAAVVSTAALTGMVGEESARLDMPVVISTWEHGIAANEAAMATIQKGGSALDAVEQGVRVSESDPEVSSVGYGGIPDRDGNVTLDACIMNPAGEAGSVGYLQHIKNPISVARLVMEKTPHVMLVGDGALKFALDQGFKKEELLTKKARKVWEAWKAKQVPVADPENHDTIGMVAMDNMGNIAGACTTSGLSWKIPGRVGDSPIIGAGMYVDNDIGGAAATGKGEAVIRIAGSFLIVELMRQGRSPKSACKLAVERIVKKQPDHKEFQVGFIALNKKGETGGFSLKKGFEYALYQEGKNKMHDADHYLKS